MRVRLSAVAQDTQHLLTAQWSFMCVAALPDAYPKSGFAVVVRFAAGGLEDEDFAGDVGGDVGLGARSEQAGC
jgi:hypothetical protein